MNSQHTLRLLGAAVATALIVMACEQGPSVPAEHTHDPQPTRPAVQTHTVTVNSADFLNNSRGLAVAGYEVTALTQSVVDSGEIHAYLKPRFFDSWQEMPFNLVAGTASVTVGVAYDEDIVLVSVIGTVVNRAVLDIFFPATLRLVIDPGTTS